MVANIKALEVGGQSTNSGSCISTSLCRQIASRDDSHNFADPAR